MQMINNLILDKSGYKPITNESLKSAFGVSWHNFIDVETWEKDGKTYTTEEALMEVEKGD
ncbi:hypothetical protein KAR91_29810 [Candidatus Pacearchaeota archaeon]|nr:hypothetical protein [Candidatus Pacearchaeota archaeon]